MSGSHLRFESIGGCNREQANALLRQQWHSTDMVIRGQIWDLSHADGFLARIDDAVVGLITFTIRNGICEITSLDSLREKQGIGTGLLERCLEAARESGCRRVQLVTTNDNLNALGFYQKRGFDLVRIRRGAMAVSRTLKPAIPLVGEHGIPLNHEIELAYEMEQHSKAESANLQEAHRSLLSTLRKCEKVLPKLREGTAQQTLLFRRIRALEIALALIKEKQDSL